MTEYAIFLKDSLFRLFTNLALCARFNLLTSMRWLWPTAALKYGKVDPRRGLRSLGTGNYFKVTVWIRLTRDKCTRETREYAQKMP